MMETAARELGRTRPTFRRKNFVNPVPASDAGHHVL
jgi:hypothetical protein